MATKSKEALVISPEVYSCMPEEIEAETGAVFTVCTRGKFGITGKYAGTPSQVAAAIRDLDLVHSEPAPVVDTLPQWERDLFDEMSRQMKEDVYDWKWECPRDFR